MQLTAEVVSERLSLRPVLSGHTMVENTMLTASLGQKLASLLTMPVFADSFSAHLIEAGFRITGKVGQLMLPFSFPNGFIPSTVQK